MNEIKLRHLPLLIGIAVGAAVMTIPGRFHPVLAEQKPGSPPPANAAPAWPPVVQPNGHIHVADYGVIADGQDHTAQLQAILDWMSASQLGVKGGGASTAMLEFDWGAVTASGSWDNLPCIRMCGAGRGLTCGTMLVSGNSLATVHRNVQMDAAGNVTAINNSTVPIEIDNMMINNNGAGHGMAFCGAHDAHFGRVKFQSRQKDGLFFPRLTFGGNDPIPNLQMAFYDCEASQCGGAGIRGWGRLAIVNGAFIQNQTAFDLSGTIVGDLLRAEVNTQFGPSFGGASSAQGVINGMTMEKNGQTQLVLGKNTNHMVFNSVLALDSRSTGSSRTGIDYLGNNCVFNASDVSGNYTTTAINLAQFAGPTVMSAVTAGNAAGAAWTVAMDQAKLTALQTNKP